MLILKPTVIAGDTLTDDFVVLDADRKTIGLIMLHTQAPPERPWLWSITERSPPYPHDRGYAESREQAMADFKTAWLRKPVRKR
jgi:hypothetical protein